MNKNLNKLMKKVASIRAKFAQDKEELGLIPGALDSLRRGAHDNLPPSLFRYGTPEQPVQESIFDSGLNPLRHLNRDGGFSYETQINPDAGVGETLGQNAMDLAMGYSGGAMAGNVLNKLYHSRRARGLGINPRASVYDLSQQAPHAFARYFGMGADGARFHRNLSGVSHIPSAETLMGIPRSFIPGLNLAQGVLTRDGRATVGAGGSIVGFPGMATFTPSTPSSAPSPIATTGVDASDVPEAVRLAIQGMEGGDAGKGILARLGSAVRGGGGSAPRGASPFFMENVDADGDPSGKVRAIHPRKSVTHRSNTNRPKAERVGGAGGALGMLLARVLDQGTPIQMATEGLDPNMTMEDYDRLQEALDLMNRQRGSYVPRN